MPISKDVHKDSSLKHLNSFDAREMLAVLGTTDLDIATFFAREFEEELIPQDQILKLDKLEQLRIYQKASINKFTRLAKLLILIKRDLISLSSNNFFYDESPSRPLEKISNQQIFTSDLVGKKTKIIDYICKCQGRCEFLYEYALGITPRDEKILQIIEQLENWKIIFNEFTNQITTIFPDESQRFKEVTERNREIIKNYIRKKVETPSGISVTEVDKLLHYLSPEYGSDISKKIIEEYIETSMVLNSVKILGRLSEDSKVTDSFIPPEMYQGLNLSEIKKNVNLIYLEAYKVKKDSALSKNEKEQALANFDEKLLSEIIPVINKISVIFPHKALGSGSTLIEILSDDNAICAGKSQIVRVVGDYLGLRNPKFTLNSNKNSLHTFNLFELPSQRTGLIDCNFSVIPESRGNVVTVKILEEFKDSSQFSELSDCLVLDCSSGEYRFFKFANNQSVFNFSEHKDFQIYRGNQVLSPTILGNFAKHSTIRLFDSFIKSRISNVEVLVPGFETWLIDFYEIEAMSKNYKLDENFFIFINQKLNFKFEALIKLISIESLRQFKSVTLLESIRDYLELEKKRNPIVFKLNYYNEREKLEFLNNI